MDRWRWPPRPTTPRSRSPPPGRVAAAGRARRPGQAPPPRARRCTPTQLAHERLGKPTALAVFASDNLSSSAYATEEILRVLVPAVGLAAFSLVVPITRGHARRARLPDPVATGRRSRPTRRAGGAYVVTRDNFGIVPAQVAGVVAAHRLRAHRGGVGRRRAPPRSPRPSTPWRRATVPISVVFICVIAYGNLRGVQESGRSSPSPPTSSWSTWSSCSASGWSGWSLGDLPVVGRPRRGHRPHRDAPATACFMGAGLFVVLHAFASGGAAVTGVEAISNGVPAFRQPEWQQRPRRRS